MDFRSLVVQLLILERPPNLRDGSSFIAEARGYYPTQLVSHLHKARHTEAPTSSPVCTCDERTSHRLPLFRASGASVGATCAASKSMWSMFLACQAEVS